MYNKKETPGFWSGVGNKFGEAGKWMADTANDGYQGAVSGLDYVGTRIGDVSRGDFSGDVREHNERVDQRKADNQYGQSAFATTNFSAPKTDFATTGGSDFAWDKSGGPVTQAGMDTSDLGWNDGKAVADMNATLEDVKEDDGSGINWALAFKDTADALSKIGGSSGAPRYAPTFKPSFRPTQIDDSIQKAQMANTNQMDIGAILSSLGGGVRGR